MRKVLTLLLIGALTGCATSGPTGDQAATTKIKGGSARLVLYRDYAYYGLALQPDYIVDGRHIGASQVNGFIVCDLSPGRHELKVEAYIGGGTEDRGAVNLQAGETAYYRGVIGLSGALTLTPASSAEGSAAITKMHQTGHC